MWASHSRLSISPTKLPSSNPRYLFLFFLQSNSQFLKHCKKALIHQPALKNQNSPHKSCPKGLQLVQNDNDRKTAPSAARLPPPDRPTAAVPAISPAPPSTRPCLCEGPRQNLGTTLQILQVRARRNWDPRITAKIW